MQPFQKSLERSKIKKETGIIQAYYRCWWLSVTCFPKLFSRKSMIKYRCDSDTIDIILNIIFYKTKELRIFFFLSVIVFYTSFCPRFYERVGGDLLKSMLLFILSL